MPKPTSSNDRAGGQRDRGKDALLGLRRALSSLFPGEFGRLREKVRPYTLLSYGRLKGIYTGVRDVLRRDVNGDAVECGAARGGSAALMGLILKKSAPGRRLWVLDTFEGLPPPTEGDPDYDKAVGKTGACKGELAEVEELFLNFGVADIATCVKGLFQDTLPLAEIGPIAFLHLDGDWYESTKVCLDRLYDKVTPGGVIQIDDYGHWAGARKALHEFFDTRGIRVKLKYLDYTGRQFVKP
jgi:O-methyltransferase